MPLITFILGLCLGVGFGFWKQHQVNQQLRRILDLFHHGTGAELTSLPVLSLVRREISRILQTSQQLEQKLQTWQQLWEIAPIGYLHVDEENQLLWCNQRARELLNIDRWEPGKVRLLLELVLSYELDRSIERTRQCQQLQVVEWESYTKNKSPLLLKASCFPQPLGTVAVFIENKQPLVELSRGRDRAFADLTHELRTPLTSISLVTELLLQRLENSERHWVERMSKEIHRLIDLVQQWLDISRLQENPSQHLQYQSILLGDLILATWETLSPLAGQKEVELTYFGDESIQLEGDPHRLTQVFLNLFHNAIKHSYPQGEIRVEVQKGSNVNINIIDSGSGFQASDLPHIFERLYRGDPSRTRQPSKEHEGSGLGLAIVQEIIQAHGGSITAQNHPETGGAWLQIILPQSSVQV